MGITMQMGELVFGGRRQDYGSFGWAAQLRETLTSFSVSAPALASSLSASIERNSFTKRVCGGQAGLNTKTHVYGSKEATTESGQEESLRRARGHRNRWRLKNS
jgi:hypothetical protein